jgi:hypothetical protein
VIGCVGRVEVNVRLETRFATWDEVADRGLWLWFFRAGRKAVGYALQIRALLLVMDVGVM